MENMLFIIALMGTIVLLAFGIMLIVGMTWIIVHVWDEIRDLIKEWRE